MGTVVMAVPIHHICSKLFSPGKIYAHASGAFCLYFDKAGCRAPAAALNPLYDDLCLARRHICNTKIAIACCMISHNPVDIIDAL